MPEIPFITRSYIIGEGSNVNVELLDVNYEDNEGINLISSKGNLKRNQDPELIPYVFSSQTIDHYSRSINKTMCKHTSF